MMDQLITADEIIHDQITKYFKLRAAFGVNAGEVQVYDADVDERKLREGVWVVPEPVTTSLLHSHSGIVLRRRWSIHFGRKGKSTSHIRRIEQGVIGALCLLVDRKGPDGLPLVVSAKLDPYTLGPIELVGPSDPDQEPIVDEPHEWSDRLTIEMTLSAQRSAIPTPPD